MDQERTARKLAVKKHQNFTQKEKRMITVHALLPYLKKIPPSTPIRFSLNGKIYHTQSIFHEENQLTIFLKEDDSFGIFNNSLRGGISDK
ncbi:MAG: hypothetical protein ACKPIZ_09965 [Microcystis panniformis]